MRTRSHKAVVLAIDIGTSSVRSALFSPAGRMRPGTLAQRRWRLEGPEPGAAQIDPDRLVSQTARCIDRTLGQAGQSVGPIAAVGCCAFWHSLVGVDAAGEPVTPLLTWADARPGAEVARLASRLDAGRTYRRTGCPLHASYWPAKLAWLRRRWPGAFRAARTWLGPADYLLAKLLGKRAMSHSTASATGLYDHRRQRWAADLCEAIGVSAKTLPAIRPLDEPLSPLDQRWARRWPRLAGSAWVAGVGDGAVSNVGAGCLEPGVAALMVGTSAAVRTIPAKGDKPPPRGLWRYRIERGWPIVGGAISNGGAIYEWLGRTLRLPSDWEARLARRPIGQHGLTVLPLLMGQRTPTWRSDVSGLIAGLGQQSGPMDIAQAFMEAVAVQIAEMVELLDRCGGGPLRLVGTGAALRTGRLWPQMIADALARPIEMARVAEASLRGAALLAAKAVGLIDELPRIAPGDVARVVKPVEGRRAEYDRLRRQMRRLYQLHFDPS